MTILRIPFSRRPLRSPARASAVHLFFTDARKGCRKGDRKGVRKCLNTKPPQNNPVCLGI